MTEGTLDLPICEL